MATVSGNMPKIHLGDSFIDHKAHEMFGTSDLSKLNKHQMNKLDKYITSQEGRAAADAFRQSQDAQFKNSLNSWKYASNQQAARMKGDIQASLAARKPITTTTSTAAKPGTSTTTTGGTRKSTTTSTTTKPKKTTTSSTTAVTQQSDSKASTTQPSVAEVIHQETVSEQPTNFSLDTFETDTNMHNFKVVGGKKYLRYDPTGWGDFWIDESKNIYTSPGFGRIGEQITDKTDFGNGYIEDAYNKLLTLLGKYKNGGTMNRINYFQQGGSAQQGAQDVQQQVVALVQAAMQGDEKANQTVTQIMEAAKAGDQQALQLAQMIQAVVKQMQGQATSAKWGSKLGYIRSLKYANGGKTCPTCEQGAPIKVEEKACGGKAKKAKKRYFGGWL